MENWPNVTDYAPFIGNPSRETADQEIYLLIKAEHGWRSYTVFRRLYVRIAQINDKETQSAHDVLCNRRVNFVATELGQRVSW